MPITATKRLQMMLAFAEHRTIEAVRRICATDWRTARRYHDIDDWPGFAAKIDAAAQEKAAAKLVKRRADFIVIINAAINQMAGWLYHRQELGAKDKSKLLPFSASDMNTLSRLVEFLEGQPDARIAHDAAVTDSQLEEWVRSLPRESQEALADAGTGGAGDDDQAADLGSGEVDPPEHEAEEDAMGPPSVADPDPPAPGA